MKKKENLIYLFERKIEFLECISQILGSGFQGVDFTKEIESLEKVMELPINRSFVSSKYDSKGL